VNINKRNVFFLLGGLLLGGLLGVLIVLGESPFNHQTGNVEAPKIGIPLKAFSLRDLDGNKISLEDYYGKPLIINFWATWCRPCEKEMPLLNETAINASNYLNVIGINVEEDRNTVLKFTENHLIDFPVLLDPDGKIADQFVVNGFPTTFFIDGNGVLRAIRVGELDQDLLIGYLSQIGVEP